MNNYMGTNTEAVKRLQRKIERDLQYSTSRKDIKIESNSILNSTNVTTPTQYTSVIPTRKQMRDHYDILLKDKIRDARMKDKSIDYSEILIQPRTFCNLDLYDDKKMVANLKVICTLPEHAVHMSNYWIGKKIDSNNFPMLVREFASQMKRHLVATVNIEESPRESTTIRRVNTNFTFA